MLFKSKLRVTDAYKLYLLMMGVQAFALTTVFTVNLVYQV